jgi:hypothetical protein
VYQREWRPRFQHFTRQLRNAVTASAAGRECSTSAIPLRATEVQDLISKGYLDEDQRHNEEATRAAVLGLLHRAMEDAGWLVAPRSKRPRVNPILCPRQLHGTAIKLWSSLSVPVAPDVNVTLSRNPQRRIPELPLPDRATSIGELLGSERGIHLRPRPARLNVRLALTPR